MRHTKIWLASILCCATPLLTTQAASPSIWNGGGADDNWTTADNWNGNVPVPDPTYDLQFGGTTRLLPLNDFPHNSDFRNITFNSDAGLFKVRGNNINLHGAILNNSATSQVLSNSVLTVSGSTVNIDGDITLSGLWTNVSVININSGNITSVNRFITGPRDGQSGAVNIKGGYYNNRAAWSFYNFMVGDLGYGALNITGGTVESRGFMLGSGSGVTGIGVGTIENAIVNVDQNVVIPYRGGTGVLTVRHGGIFQRITGTTKVLNVNQQGNGRGELNLLGGTIDNRGGTIGFGTGSSPVTGGNGIVNINAGTLTLARFIPTAGNNFINLNGGTLRPFDTSVATFLPAGEVTVYVNGPFGSYAGGAVLDSAGTVNTIAEGLLAPTGDGVAAVSVATAGSGYIGAPYVSIVDYSFSGVGATAVAIMADDGSGNGTLKVTGVEITNPGINYQAGITFCTFAGGGTTTPATPGDVTLAANTSGGLTKIGQGTFILNDSATYTGPTIITEGTLAINSTTAGGAVTVQAGGALGGVGTVGGPVTIANGGSITPGDPAVTLAAGTLTLGNTLTLSGPNTLQFDFLDSATVDKLIVNGDLVVTGVTSFDLPGSSGVMNGDYTLIEVHGNLGGTPANFTVANPDPFKTYQVLYDSGKVVLRIGTTAAYAWAGGTGVWDVNGAMNWLDLGAPAKFQNGSPATFGDTGASVPNVNITANVAPSTVAVDGNADYTFTGAGAITGNALLAKSGAGALTIATANTFTGGATLNEGTLNINNPSAIGTGELTINGGALGNTSASPVTLPNNPQTWAGDFAFNTGELNLGAGPVDLTVVRNLNVAAGTLTVANLTGTGGINKSGDGTLVLAGTNTFANAFTVSGGAVNINGSVNSGGTWTIASPDKAVLNIDNNADILKTGLFNIGRAIGSSAAVNFRSGTLISTPVWNFNNFAIGDNGYGAFNMTGGAIESHGFILNGQSANANGLGIVTISGGTWAVDAQVMVPYFGGVGVLTINGGALNRSAGSSSLAINSRGYGRGEVNLLSGAIDNANGPVYFGLGVATGIDPNSGTGVLNLNAGTMTASFMSNFNATTFINFNGATAKASMNYARFIAPAEANPPKVIVNGPFGTFTGGAVIDSAGFNIGIPADLTAPTGFGVTSLAVTDGGNGYIGEPYVSIVDSSGTGKGATAIAVMVDDGTGKGTLRVASVRVTNPGVDYTSGSVSYTFRDGAPTVAATPGSATTAANTSGGFTKLGEGTLALSGANTYTGPTLVNGGTLAINGTIAPQSTVTVATGATLSGNGTIGGPVNLQSGAAFAPGSPIGALTVNNTLTLPADSTTLVDVDLDGATQDSVIATTVNYGGALVVTNHTGAFQMGQVFQLFSAGAHSGNFSQVVVNGATGSFDPTSGTLSITGTIADYPTNITVTLTQNQVVLTWPETHKGWYAQSNAVEITDSAAWFNIPGSESQTSLNIPVNTSSSQVFYRLRKP